MRSRLSTRVAALGLLLALGLTAAHAGENRFDDPSQIRVGKDGLARVVFQPEFRSAKLLLGHLTQYGVKDLHAELVTPFVAVAVRPGEKPEKPRLSRILLRGKAPVVRHARELLARLDAPQRSVFVSVLMSEVKHYERESTGGSMILDKSLGPNPDVTFFRGFNTQFEPDDFIRSQITGSPFQGTSLFFGDMDIASGGSFAWTLRMLMREGDAEYLAWPSLLCNEEQPARMESTQEVPQQLLVAGRTVEDLRIAVTRVQVGVKLRVTPITIGTDSAELDLDVWLRLPEEITDGTAPFGSLRLKLRQVRTRLTVRDREPLLVGGLHIAGRQKRRRGLPRPKELALLDPLHSSRFLDDASTEILFLVRARIVQPCRRPPELYPDGYQAWTSGRLPDGRVVRSPWANVPKGEKQMDEMRPGPFKR